MNLYIFINLLEFMHYTYNIETFAPLPTIVGIVDKKTGYL